MSGKSSLRIVELLERARIEGDWTHVSQVGGSFSSLFFVLCPSFSFSCFPPFISFSVVRASHSFDNFICLFFCFKPHDNFLSKRDILRWYFEYSVKCWTVYLSLSTLNNYPGNTPY